MIDNDRTLLFEDSDPGVPGTSWWTTPGGGVDEGESEISAAIREVAEETGYRLTERELLGPIAKRHVVHGYSDLVIEQDESFFLAMVSPFEMDISAHTPDERLTLLGHRWWTHDDLRHTDDWVWPHELVELWSLAGQPDAWPYRSWHPGGVHGSGRDVEVPTVSAQSGRTERNLQFRFPSSRCDAVGFGRTPA
jgi:8-oxo-dGTP pyrophosphatase MutT (NUDIX family)